MHAALRACQAVCCGRINMEIEPDSGSEVQLGLLLVVVIGQRHAQPRALLCKPTVESLQSKFTPESNAEKQAQRLLPCTDIYVNLFRDQECA